MDTLLKKTLKRQVPYLIGGTITGTFIAYYYGFLFSIIVNSILWFVISTIVNKYYWHYTGFKDEMRLISKYLIHKKDTNTKSNSVHSYNNMKEEYHMTTSNDSLNPNSDKLRKNNQNNIGSPI